MSLGAFGQTPSLFGAAQPLFSQQQQQTQGTRTAEWKVTEIRDPSSTTDINKYFTISFMEQFRNFSVEELRFQDYSRGDKGDQTANFAQSTPFANNQPSASAFASTPFGAQPQTSAFGPTFQTQSSSALATPTPFGATQSSFATSQPAFGASQPLFGASQPSFGTSAFGASSAPLFGSSMSQPPGGLFAGSQPSAGIFGASQPQSAPSLFGASSSALGGTSAFAGGFGASQPTSAPSLFGGGASSGAGLFGNTGAGLFGNTSGTLGNTGGGLFGNTGAGFANTGGGLFGSTPSWGFGASSAGLFGGASSGGLFGATSSGLFGASSGNLFGSSGGGLFGQGGFGGGFGAAQPAAQPQSQGPLEASLTMNPFGSSNLFSGIAQSASKNIGASVVGGSRPVSVVVGSAKPYRRTRTSELVARNVMRRRAGGGGWFMASPMKPWGENGGVFDIAGVLGRTEEQRRRAANLKRLVVEPLQDDPVLTASARFGAKIMTENEAEEERGEERVDDEEEVEESMTGNENEMGMENGGTQNIGQMGDAGAGERDENGGQELQAIRTPIAKDSPGRYVPYKEFYRNQMSGTRRRQSMNGDRGLSEGKNGVLNVPKCTNLDIYVYPSLEEMGEMSNEELSRIPNLTIGKEGMGEIAWLEPTDVRGLDFDRIVEIKPKEVSVYPRDEDLPPVGVGLNKKARIKLFGITKVDRASGAPKTDAGTAAKMVAKLKAHCEREGLTFLGYDIKSGVWSFEANNF